MDTVTKPTDDPALDDATLVERARAGDTRATGALVSRHQGVVYRYLVGILEEEDLAADVAQDTFVQAIRHLEQFRGDSSFRTWLLAIARNEARGALRKRKRNRTESLDMVPEPDAEGLPPDVEVERRIETERVREALRRLPEKQKLSVALRLFDGLSFREVAEATDTTEGAARVNYHFGIRKLREMLS